MSFRRYRPYKQGEFILVAADTSSGGGDYCAAQFLSKTNLDIPVVYHSEVTASEMTPQLHIELGRIHKETGVKPVVAYETNNGGVFELQRLATLNRDGHYIMYQQKRNVGTTEITENTIKYGFNTNSATRPAILQILKEAIDNRLIKIYDKPTINEMFAFILKPNGRPEAEKGAHDDLVMSLAIAYEMYQTEAEPTKQITDVPRYVPSNFMV
jgi:phage terminase large subunit